MNWRRGVGIAVDVLAATAVMLAAYVLIAACIAGIVLAWSAMVWKHALPA